MSESAVPSAARMLRVLALLVGALGAAGVAAPALASLREAPPKGVDLSGSWELDPVRSDDPEIVRAQVREAMRQQMEKMRRKRGRGGWGGGGGGDDDRNGDGTDTDGSGRRSPGGGSGPEGGRGGGGGGRHRLPGGGGAGSGTGDGGTGGGAGESPGDDAAGDRGERGGGPGGGAGPERNPNFAALSNPARVPFEQLPGTVRTALGDGPFDCEPGETVSVTDMQGMAERHCGWNGNAFVVMLDRKRGVSREDRFELSRDRKLLLYTTTLSGGKLPKVSVKRTYVRSERPD